MSILSYVTPPGWTGPIWAMNFITWVFCYCFQSDKLTDITYSVSFFTTALMMVYDQKDQLDTGLDQAKIYTAIMVLTWSFRLGAYLFYRVHLMGRDNRFDKIRTNFKRITRFFILQAASIWILMLPVNTMMRSVVQEELTLV